jgi:hypothetical protein
MQTNHLQNEPKEKVDIESCKRIVLLARYRVEEDDLHEAFILFQEALMLTNPSSCQEEEECTEATCRLRYNIFLEIGELLIRMGRLQKAELYVIEGTTFSYIASRMERDKSHVNGLLDLIRKRSTDKPILLP